MSSQRYRYTKKRTEPHACTAQPRHQGRCPSRGCDGSGTWRHASKADERTCQQALTWAGKRAASWSEHRQARASQPSQPQSGPDLSVLTRSCALPCRLAHHLRSCTKCSRPKRPLWDPGLKGSRWAPGVASWCASHPPLPARDGWAGSGGVAASHAAGLVCCSPASTSHSAKVCGPPQWKHERSGLPGASC